jgi:RNA polymerase sigma factor (sigma-70 family)
MTRMHPANLNHQYRSLFGGGRLADLGEGQLLDRFLKERDEVAFEELVARHGPMVLGVCRRWLNDPNDVDDAFQATFLILIRKAGSLRDQKTVSRWLYGVSQRVARRARSQALRVRERLVPVPREARTSRPAQDEAASREILSIVDEEVHRLPRKQQAVAVLCMVQGWTHEEAARALEWPLGTVKSRVASAREALRSRLSRRGIDSPDALLAALPPTWRIGRSTALAQRSRRILLAIDGAINPASRGSAASTVALELSRGVMRSLFMKNMLIRSAMAMLAAGVGAMAYQREGGVSSQPETTAQPAGQLPARPAVKLGPIQKAFEKAVRAAGSIDDPADRAEHLLWLGIARTRQGNLSEARVILRKALLAARAIEANSTYTFPHPIIRIAGALAEANDREGAHRTFQQAVPVIQSEDWEHQRSNWSDLIRNEIAIDGRARMDGTFAAYRTFLENEPEFKSHHRDKLFGLDIAESGRFEDVLKDINHWKFGVDYTSLSRRAGILLDIASYFGPRERAEVQPLLIEARRLIDDDPFLEQKHSLLQNLAAEQARLGLFPEALATAWSIIPGDKELSTSLVIADQQMRAGDREGVRSSVGKALEAIDTTELRGPQTDLLMLSAGRLLTQIGDFDGALRTIERLKRTDYAIGSLQALARRQAQGGDRAGARATWIQALSAAERLPRQPRATIAGIQAEMGDLAGAFKTVDMIEIEDEKSKALSGVAVALAAVGDLDAAASVVDRITSPRVRDDAWIRVAGAAPGRKNGEP